MIEDLDVALRLADIIFQAMDQENSWRLELQNGDVMWSSGSQIYDHEPETGRWQRFESYFLQLLPIEKYL